MISSFFLTLLPPALYSSNWLASSKTIFLAHRVVLGAHTLAMHYRANATVVNICHILLLILVFDDKIICFVFYHFAGSGEDIAMMLQLGQGDQGYWLNWSRVWKGSEMENGMRRLSERCVSGWPPSNQPVTRLEPGRVTPRWLATYRHISHNTYQDQTSKSQQHINHSQK